MRWGAAILAVWVSCPAAGVAQEEWTRGDSVAGVLIAQGGILAGGGLGILTYPEDAGETGIIFMAGATAALGAALAVFLYGEASLHDGGLAETLGVTLAGTLVGAMLAVSLDSLFPLWLGLSASPVVGYGLSVEAVPLDPFLRNAGRGSPPPGLSFTLRF